MTSISAEASRSKRVELEAVIKNKSTESLLDLLKELDSASAKRMRDHDLVQVEKNIVTRIMTGPESVWAKAAQYIGAKKDVNWIRTRISNISAFSTKAVAYLIIGFNDDTGPGKMEKVDEAINVIWDAVPRLSGPDGILYHYRSARREILHLHNAENWKSLGDEGRAKAQDDVEAIVNEYANAVVLRCVLIASEMATISFLEKEEKIIRSALKSAPDTFAFDLAARLQLYKYISSRYVGKLEVRCCRKAKMAFMTKLIECGMPVPDNFLSHRDAVKIHAFFNSVRGKKRNPFDASPPPEFRANLKVISSSDESVPFFDKAVVVAAAASIPEVVVVGKPATSDALMEMVLRRQEETSQQLKELLSLRRQGSSI